MNLCDSEILESGEALVSPFDPNNIQPASYDVTLFHELLVPKTYEELGVTAGSYPLLDLRHDDPAKFMKKLTMVPSLGYNLLPGQCLLGSTSEIIKIPNNIIGRIEGKSTMARLFVVVHSTAGYLDPGFQGNVTLEIINHGPWAVKLWPGMDIAQVAYGRMSKEADRPYGSEGLGSHYQGQLGPTAASGNRGI